MLLAVPNLLGLYFIQALLIPIILVVLGSYSVSLGYIFNFSKIERTVDVSFAVIANQILHDLTHKFSGAKLFSVKQSPSESLAFFDLDSGNIYGRWPCKF